MTLHIPAENIVACYRAVKNAEARGDHQMADDFYRRWLGLVENASDEAVNDAFSEMNYFAAA
jgi:hypothetical protein